LGDKEQNDRPATAFGIRGREAAESRGAASLQRGPGWDAAVSYGTGRLADVTTCVPVRRTRGDI